METRVELRRLDWSDQLEDVAEGLVDVCLVWLPPGYKVAGVVKTVIARERLVAAVSPTHRLTQLDLIQGSGLTNEQFLDSPRSSGSRLRLGSWYQWLSLHTSVNTLDEADENVEVALVIAVLSESIAAMHMRPPIVGSG